ncbi:MAG TPA: hypothetical protein VKU02_17930 [Gemmataceae bacterium]|nr:hypothetical protein [Gemmataceae bacterium]
MLLSCPQCYRAFDNCLQCPDCGGPLQYRIKGKAEQAELSAFAGSDAYRWRNNDPASPSGVTSSWRSSRSLGLVFRIVLVLGLSSVAFVVWTLGSHLWSAR